MTDLDAYPLDEEPRVPRRISAIEMMGRTLVDLHADLGDEAACSMALTHRGFEASEISYGLEHAIDRAREIKARTDTPLLVIRDLAAVTIFMAAVILWALPAKAASGSIPDDGLVLAWWLVLGFALNAAILGVGMLIWRPRKGR